MPAASAALRCAASTPSNHRSPAFAGRSCALTRQSALPTSTAARDRERIAALGGILCASDAARLDLFPTPVLLGDRNALLQPLHRGQLELPSKAPARQSTDSFSPCMFLSLNRLPHFWGKSKSGCLFKVSYKMRSSIVGSDLSLVLPVDRTKASPKSACTF